MTAIPQRRIGRDGPTTGVLSLGSWHTYDRVHFGEAVRLLRTAVDAGISLFDVGVYGVPSARPDCDATNTCSQRSCGWRTIRTRASATSSSMPCSAPASSTPMW